MVERAEGRSSGDGEASSAERLLRQTQRLRQEADRLMEAAGEALQEVEATLRERLERSPYAVLGGAFGTGYVLGGGVPAFVTRRFVELGARIAVAALIRTVLSRSGDAEHTNAEQTEGESS